MKTSVASIIQLVDGYKSLNTAGMLLSTTLLGGHMHISLNL